jgi:hypothetical protein
MCWSWEERAELFWRELEDEREPVRVEDESPEPAEEQVRERDDERELVHA